MATSILDHRFVRTAERVALLLILGKSVWNTVHIVRSGSITKSIIRCARRFSTAVDVTIRNECDEKASEAVHSMFSSDPPTETCIPQVGRGYEAVLGALTELSKSSVHASDGRIFAYAYPIGAEHEAFITSVHNMFMQQNALNPIVFPALRKFEIDIVRMTCSMLHGDPSTTCGVVTSGGTESILMAVKAYRDRARSRLSLSESDRLEMILPTTAHPAFLKAASYFDVQPILIPVGPNFTVDVQEVRRKISKRTMMIVGSAPQYPHGVMDPIAELGKIAEELNIPFHVDACIGGFFLPWIEKLGHKIPLWDFRVPGVTSISCDPHKYGYCGKGVSVLVYRSDEYRRFQFFVCSSWPGGLFFSSSMLGTRGGGPIATAWASFQALGENYYLKIAESIMKIVGSLQEGILSIPELEIVGSPCMSIVSVRAAPGTSLNIYAVCDYLELKCPAKWHMECQKDPDCFHMTISPSHATTVDQFIVDLRNAVAYVKEHPESSKENSAAMYGELKSIPDEQIVDQFLLSFCSKTYSSEK